jgi:hypothetical protein
MSTRSLVARRGIPDPQPFPTRLPRDAAGQRQESRATGRPAGRAARHAVHPASRCTARLRGQPDRVRVRRATSGPSLGLVSISGVSRPQAGEASRLAVQTAFMNTVGQKLVRLSAKVSLRSIVEGTLDETSTFTDQQKADRTAYILRHPQARALFSALFDTTTSPTQTARPARTTTPFSPAASARLSASRPRR